MKKKMILLFILGLLYAITINQTDSILNNFEFLSIGISSKDGEFNLLNYLLNVSVFIIFLTNILEVINSIFKSRCYVISRGGQINFKKILIIETFKKIFFILILKQILYSIFFIKEQNFTIFYFYDMVSTLLTLGMFALISIFLKLWGTKDKTLLFLIIFVYMVSQALSFNNPIFSIFTIASIDWYETYFLTLLFKTVIIMILIGLVFNKSNLDNLIGENEE